MVRWLQIALPFVVLLIAVVTRGVNPELFETLDLKTFDFYQQKSPRIYSEVIPGTNAPMPVKVVDIDDESLSQFGQWPDKRNHLFYNGLCAYEAREAAENKANLLILPPRPQGCLCC